MSLPVDYTDAIVDYACEEFETNDPTFKQLEQAEKEYLELLERNQANVGDYDTN
jgi:hypothetical protein